MKQIYLLSHQSKFMLCLILAIQIFFPDSVQAQKRTYLIGNSVTDEVKYSLFDEIVENNGISQVWGRHMIPGAPLDFIWDNPTGGFSQDPYGYYVNALNNYAWDHITLQPFDRKINSDVEYIGRFKDLAKAKNPNVQIFIYQRWPKPVTGFSKTADGWNGLFDRTYTDGWDRTNETRDYFEQLVTRLKTTYTDVPSILMIPVGEVMYSLNNKMKNGNVSGYSSIWDIYSDDIHLTDAGSYMVALTFFTTIYKKDPRGTSVPSGFGNLSTAYINAVQNTVWEVVNAKAAFTGFTTSGNIAVTGVSVSPATLQLTVGSTANVSATVSPSNATNKSITWKSNNELIATVTSSGLVTATGAGSAIITATTVDGGKTATTTVTITASGGDGETISGTLAAWDFTGKGGASVVSTTNGLAGTASAAPSLVAAVGSGLAPGDYLSNGLTASDQTSMSLSEAISGNEFIKFTVGPASGKTITINTIRIRPVSQNRVRTFTLYSSVKGFTAGNEIATFTASYNSGAPLQTITISGHSNLASNVEFRLYIHGYNNKYEKVGIGNRKSGVSEADLLVEGSVTGGVDTTPPGAPGSLSASNVKHNTFDLTWTHATDNVGISGYDVFRGSTKLNSSVIAGNSFVVSGLSTCTSNSYTVKAYDNAGNSSTSTALNVKTNCPPVAVISSNVSSGTAPLTVSFNASQSTDPDANDFILGYEWNFGDGSPIESNNSPSHTFSNAGTYTVTLRVMDNRDLYSSATTTTIVVGNASSNLSVQAENYSSVGGSGVYSTHTGYNGTGYLDYGGINSYGEWNINAPSAGTYTMEVRYALGNTTARPCAVIVNGTNTGSVNLDNTGAWNNWNIKSYTVSLLEGGNIVRLIATTSNGGPNVDQLHFVSTTTNGTSAARTAFEEVSIANLELEKTMIYPNPGSDVLNIGLDSQATNVKIFNLQGILVLEASASNSINVSSLAPGLYHVQLNNKIYKYIKK